MKKFFKNYAVYAVGSFIFAASPLCPPEKEKQWGRGGDTIFHVMGILHYKN